MNRTTAERPTEPRPIRGTYTLLRRLLSRWPYGVLSFTTGLLVLTALTNSSLLLLLCSGWLLALALVSL